MRKSKETTQPSAEKLPRGIWVLVGAAFVIAIGYGIITPVLPQYAHSFNVSIMAASAIVSVFGIARLVFAPASGALINRLGERRMYMTGVFIVALSTLATAFASNYWLLLLYRGLGGIGSTLFTVSATGMIVRMAPAHMRGRASSAYGGAFLVGNISGPILGGLLGNISLRLPFFVYTASLLVAIVVIWFLLPPSALTSAGDAHNRKETTDGDISAEKELRIRDVIKDSAYRACLVTNFSNGWGNFGVRVALLPLFVAALLNTNGAAEAGIAMAIFAVGNAIALYTTRHWSDRWGRRPMIISGLIICGIMTAALGQGTTIGMVYVLSFFAGLGGGVINPAQQAAIGDVVAGYKGGTVLASVQMAADLGSIVGTLAAGAIVDHLSFAWAFATTGIILAASSLAWVPARETLPSTARERR
ncbi:MAG: MFS transporter [Lawsonella sp.]